MLDNNTQQSSKVYYENLFHESNVKYKNIYLLPCIVTAD